MRDIDKRTKAAVIGVLEPKLDSTVLDPEICEILRGGVACYIRSDISYKLIFFLENEIKTIPFDILMPHNKPITIGIIYRPQISLNFLIILKKIYLNSTQAFVKFTLKAISTLIFLKTENMFAINPLVTTKA